jgi:hypothetical protein
LGRYRPGRGSFLAPNLLRDSGQPLRITDGKHSGRMAPIVLEERRETINWTIRDHKSLAQLPALAESINIGFNSLMPPSPTLGLSVKRKHGGFHPGAIL